MKKHLLSLLIAASCLTLLPGCTAHKKTYERGWIGGQYLESNPSLFKKITANYFDAHGTVIPALPEQVKQKQSGAVFVSRVFDNTPLMNAGIKPGDLIIAVNDQGVENLKRFRELVDETRPGEEIVVSLYRAGEMLKMPVVVGKETYQKWGYFNLGFHLASELDPIPNPNFSLLGLVSFKTNDIRLELNSPEYQYYRRTLDLAPEASDRLPNSEVDAEGWDTWFVIFGFSGKKIILNQES